MYIHIHIQTTTVVLDCKLFGPNCHMNIHYLVNYNLFDLTCNMLYRQCCKQGTSMLR